MASDSFLIHLTGAGLGSCTCTLNWLCSALVVQCLKVRNNSGIGHPHLSAVNINLVYFSCFSSASVIRMLWTEAGAIAGVLKKCHGECDSVQIIALPEKQTQICAPLCLTVIQDFCVWLLFPACNVPAMWAQWAFPTCLHNSIVTLQNR